MAALLKQKRANASSVPPFQSIAGFLSREQYPILLGLGVLAFWPVWRWYGRRMLDGSDDPWGAVALAAMLFFLFRRGQSGAIASTSFGLSALCTLGYVAGYHLLPALPRAGLAVIAIVALLDARRSEHRFDPGIFGLGLLSLPVIASLQFYFGYPLRTLTAMAAAPLLRLNGVAVHRQGTALDWSGLLVEIDAPCSGVKMLWVGMFICCTLICLFRLPPARAVVALALSLATILFGNLLRATALFYVESGIVRLPAFTHSGVGLAVFFGVAATIAYGVRWLGRGLKPMQVSAPEIESTIQRRPPRRPAIAAFALCCLLAAIMPLTHPAAKAQPTFTAFDGFPTSYDGLPLTELPLTAVEKAFAADFPGKIGRFSDGRREIIFRWIATDTRQLHSPVDCFKALGYSIHPLPLLIDETGRRWGRFEAKQSGESLLVSERYYDQSSEQAWTDVSSWYWAALLGQSQGPWWAITIAERQ